MADEKPKVDSRLAEARKRAAALAKAGPGGSPKSIGDFFKSIGQFFKQTIAELRKTTWPDQQTLQKSTAVVLGIIVASAVWVGGLDFILTTVQNNLGK